MRRTSQMPLVLAENYIGEIDVAMHSSFKMTFSCLLVALLLLAGVAAAETVYKIDFSAPDAMDKIEIPYEEWKFHVKNDPTGESALFFPQGSDAQRMPNTYGSMRYFLLDTPPVDSFELTWEAMDGWPDGETRSQLIVFGWEDYRNWDFVYLTYTDTSRVTRLVNGRQVDVNNPGVTNIWPKGSPTYIPVKMRITTDGDHKLIELWIDGKEATPLHGTRIPLSEYKPGKVGIGALSYSAVQAMFVKNVELKVLD